MGVKRGGVAPQLGSLRSKEKKGQIFENDKIKMEIGSDHGERLVIEGLS